MRNELAACVIAAGLLLAGCSTGETSADPPPNDSARTAAAKSLDVADRCSLLAEDQARALGLDQAPKPGNTNGKAGCQYEAGTPGGPGWSAFVAADTQRTFLQFIGAELGSQRLDLGGYPTAKVNNASGCTFVVDVADTGSLLVTALVRSGAPIEVGTSCDAAKRVAEAAIQNLPAA
ncbi:DUF3558 domain-containing protein [Saccharopolyspora sp. K220]|uniref:DUF3558 domain-containing protein n=1 Tax=Saccharopolyspora soli TaxID=2926618 RepID=UPI001F58232B|nr:DUF3558 domain-containing protein [Saccharopolyspora soli]MCI2423919.1 DUF3558 domain-containing protein [Saccharopolyspora soli]